MSELLLSVSRPGVNARPRYDGAVPHVRLFAAAREAAGCGRADIEGGTVGAVLDAAEARFGANFAAVLPTCRIWVNGEPAAPGDTVADTDELAVLPPVSGG